VSKLNRSPRVFSGKTTFRTIIHPDVNTSARDFPGLRMSDFIEVPRLATQGEWPISHMLPDEQLVHLAVLAGHLSGNKPKSSRARYSERFEEKRKARVAAGKAAKEGAHRG
jgi:hypothetical protein